MNFVKSKAQAVKYYVCRLIMGKTKAYHFKFYVPFFSHSKPSGNFQNIIQTKERKRSLLSINHSFYVYFLQKQIPDGSKVYDQT